MTKQTPARRALGLAFAALALALLAPAVGRGQMTAVDATTVPYDPEYLIRNTMLGEGVEVTNVTFEGTAQAVGYFRSGNSALDIEEGIVLTTGFVEGVQGINQPSSNTVLQNNLSTASDPYLEGVLAEQGHTGVPLMNVARYVIDFIPSGDRVSFNYVFASEEYPEFVCSAYNDIFGFFIEGPGFAGPYVNGAENLATIPGTTIPVRVNTINPGVQGSDIRTDISYCQGTEGSLAYSSLYVDNLTTPSYPVYDGLTTKLTAEASVQPCQPYRITIAIADVNDFTYDSGVFLEANSFNTETIDLSVESDAIGGQIAEGCGTAEVIFSTQSPQSTAQTYSYTVAGTATEGTDYANLSGTVTLPAGATEVRVPISAFDDGIAEGRESVEISLALSPCRDVSATVYIVDRDIPTQTFSHVETVCPGTDVDLDATLPVTLAAPIVAANSMSELFAIPGMVLEREIVVAGVTPPELGNGHIARVCVDVEHSVTGAVNLLLVSPAGKVLELSTENGGTNTAGYRNVCFTTDAPTSIDNPMNPLPFAGDYRPEGNWADLWRGSNNPVNGTWRLLCSHDAFVPGFFRSWSIEFNRPYDLTYAWTPTTGLSCADCPNPTASITADIDYTVTATDSYGCTEVGTADLDVYDPAVAPTLTCVPGFDNLRWTWTLDAAAIRYEVSVDGGAFVDIGLVDEYGITGMAIGQSASVEVRAVGNCDAASSMSSCVTQTCPAVGLSASVTNASCAGYTDGEVAFTASGGAAPYTFTLGGISNTTGVFTMLSAGSYTATVSDVNGCAGSTSFDILEPNGIISSTTTTAPTACGDPWRVTATASAGAGAPYGFVWSDGQTGANASFSVSGTYTVTISDRNGCSVQEVVDVTVADALSATWTGTDATCNGANDGTITATATGGTPPLEYNIGGGYQSSPSFSGLTPGTYNVRVRDAIGCVESDLVEIAEPAALQLSLAATEVSCFGRSDGSAISTVTGGTPPYNYSWSSGSTDPDATGLSEGTYTLTVVDAQLCTVSESIAVAQPDELFVSLSATDVSCFGGSDGVLTAVPTGGTAPYTYTWTTGDVTTVPQLAGLPEGIYGVTVTDARNCTDGANVTVGEPTALVASHTVQPVGCAGAATGSINLIPGGGTAPYTFAWSNGATTEDVSDLTAGVYSVTITDALGCTLPYTVDLAEPPVLAIETTPTHVSCFGYDDGAIASTPSGGVEPYTYEWRGPNGYAFFDANPEQLLAGDYELTFRDAYGCEIRRTVTVTEPVAISLATTAGDSICFGSASGRAWVTVTGGTAPFAYAWDNGESSDTAYALTSGVHAVDVLDANGCAFSADVAIATLPEIRLTLAQDPTRCYGDSNGVARVIAVEYGTTARAVSGLDYAWDFDASVTGPELTGLGGLQEVRVTGTDTRGCQASASIEVGEPRALLAETEVLSHVRCRDGSDGSAAAVVTGGNGNYRFEWLSPTASPGTQSVNDLPAGEHFVVAFDQNDCADTASVVLLQPDSLLVEVDAQAVNCFDQNSGAAMSSVRGGTEPYRYAWSNGGVTPQLAGLDSGMYVLVTTDANGCTSADSAAVTGFDFVVLEADVTGVTCNGDRDGAILLSATGGRGPHEFMVTGSPLINRGEFRYLQPGVYDAVAVDRDGCPSDTMQVEVAEPQPVLVEAGEEVELELGTSTDLFAQVFNTVGAVSYRWSPDNSDVFSCLDCPDPTFTPDFQGLVRVNVIDERGCEGEDVVRVKVNKELQVLVPTGFTPNSDGVDDRLLVHGRSGTRVKTFQVYNRWGTLVHESQDFYVNNASAGWDGRVNGTWAPAGPYLYRAEVEFLDGIVEVISGETTLVR